MSRRFTPHSTAIVPERALLVGVDLGERDDWPQDRSMAELARLVETDGAEVAGELTQRLAKPVPKTFIGSGKTEELVERVRAEKIDVVVFDEDLTPSQQSNLERAVGKDVKIIDRTALILDIFGRHATTVEGRLQVELAQLRYVLPRLRGMWSHLMGEQTRGGIGSRFGQGESQLEVDRRMVRNRIAQVRRELERVDARRQTQSKARWESGVFRVALVGYTNAGKSTLMNALTGADVYVRDELFATLDATTRSLALEEGRTVTLTDTVGFIQKLPTTLVEAFRSTLAEVREANLILCVADASDDAWEAEVRSVVDTLAEIEATDIPRVLCLNKVDLLGEDAREALRLRHPDAQLISALEERGLADLRHRIATEAAAGEETLTALIPFSEGRLVKLLHERCQVIHELYVQEGLLITVKAPEALARSLEGYVCDASDFADEADAPGEGPAHAC